MSVNDLIAVNTDGAFSPTSGSYSSSDCLFLLRPVQADVLTVEEKENRLQKGGQHYSEMVSQESPPSDEYRELFFSLVGKYKRQLAAEVAALAKKIVAVRRGEVTLLSLARAGTPVGVLLQRAIQHYYPDVSSVHYAISIVRDFGVDNAALSYVLSQGCAPESIIFVDGWTAKGVISKELKGSIQQWNHQHDVKLPDTLCVVSDIGGAADLAATNKDYAMPWGILNSTVSGLISRSIRPAHHQGIHQCVQYNHLQSHDLTNWFVDTISAEFACLGEIPDVVNGCQQHRQSLLLDYIERIMNDYHITDVNKIKPGIAEATRVMLRRIPRLLIIKHKASEDVQHLLALAKEKGVKINEDHAMPFQAVALIAEVD